MPPLKSHVIFAPGNIEGASEIANKALKWQVVTRPEAENDVIEIAAWYDSRSEGLGDRFVEEFLALLDQLTLNPLLHCRRHPSKNIRWRYPRRFPHRIIYEVIEQEKLVVVAAGGARCQARPTMEATSVRISSLA